MMPLQQARNNALALAQEMRAEIQAETDRQKAELDARLAEEAQKPKRACKPRAMPRLAVLMWRRAMSSAM